MEDIIFSNIDLTFNLYNVHNSITDTSNNVGIIHYDKTTIITHPHLLNNTITHANGRRVFFNEVVNFSVTYPSISNIVLYDHTANHGTFAGGYTKEAVLYNNHYYGSNNDSGPKQNWTTLNAAFIGAINISKKG